MQTKLAIWNETGTLLYPTQLPVQKGNTSTKDRKPCISRLFLGSLKHYAPSGFSSTLASYKSVFHSLNILFYQEKNHHLAERCSKTERARGMEQKREETSATPSLGTGMLTEYFPTHCSALSQALCKTALSGRIQTRALPKDTLLQSVYFGWFKCWGFHDS